MIQTVIELLMQIISWSACAIMFFDNATLLAKGDHIRTRWHHLFATGDNYLYHVLQLRDNTMIKVINLVCIFINFSWYCQWHHTCMSSLMSLPGHCSWLSATTSWRSGAPSANGKQRRVPANRPECRSYIAAPKHNCPHPLCLE